MNKILILIVTNIIVFFASIIIIGAKDTIGLIAVFNILIFGLIVFNKPKKYSQRNTQPNKLNNIQTSTQPNKLNNIQTSTQPKNQINSQISNYKKPLVLRKKINFNKILKIINIRSVINIMKKHKKKIEIRKPSSVNKKTTATIKKNNYVFKNVVSNFKSKLLDLKKVKPGIKKKEKNSKNKIKDTKKTKIFKIIAILGLTGLIFTLLFLTWFIFTVIKLAPEFNPDNLFKKEATVIYDKDNKVIAKIGSEIREKITYDQMPQVLIDAIVATEDSRFFSHNGFDLPRFVKASIGQATGNRSAGGASTLTMQVSKNNFTSTDADGIDGIMRKFTDIYISIFKIEKKYTKFEIIEFYANSNYLGNGAYGVEQASLVYFAKSAKDMNLAEAATIAGLFQAPNSLDPTRNPEKSNARKNTVLYLMKRHGYITEEERKIASNIHVTELLKADTKKIGEFQAFINTVTEEVEIRTGKNPYTVPMEIYTTMDREKQTYLDKVFSGELFTWENEKVNAGTAVIDVKTGAIAAIGAGRNHTGQKVFNFATMTKRQIGSTAKPFYDYGPGIEYNNWNTYTPFGDEPHAYSDGKEVKNWDNKFQGFMTLREALKVSRNIPSLKAFQSLKKTDILKFVESVGLSPEKAGNTLHEAHALGGYNGESPVALAAAYATFANGGYYTEPHSFTKIIYKDTKEVFENKLTRNKVMKEETAYMITDILVQSSDYSFKNSSVNGTAYASKTGTSNFTKEIIQKHGLSSSAINDLWVGSYSPSYAIAQWYGYDKISAEYHTKFGNTQNRKLFQASIKGLYTDGATFTRPKGVISVTVEKDTYPGMLPSEFTPSDMKITELFIEGTEPTEVSQRYSKLKAPTNLTLKENTGKLEITWEAVKKPDFADTDFLTKKYKSIFNTSSFSTNYLNSHLAYNNAYIGEFGYQVSIYEGETLKESKFVTNNAYSYNLTGPGNIKVRVKSSYSIFKANGSNEIEKSYSSTTPQAITSTMNGSATNNITIGSTYIEPVKPITVTESGTDVTNLAVITKKIEDSNGNTISSIPTNQAGTFYINYSVTYLNHTKTHKRTIIVQ